MSSKLNFVKKCNTANRYQKWEKRATRKWENLDKEFKELHAAFESLREKHNLLVDQHDNLQRFKPSQRQQTLFD